MKLIIVLALVFALIALVLLLLQHRMIYFPRPYEPGRLSRLPAELLLLDYTTTEGKQVTFYLPPRERPQEPPGRLWVMFGGNATLALDWMGFIEGSPHTRDGFLLIDYPGYGENEGRASPVKIPESTEEAFRTLARHLGVEPSALESGMGVIGHSLGAAAALQFATRRPVERVLLIAPFTTMRDMAVRTVGYPLCYLLTHRFDNRRRLAELSKRPNPPQVAIIHGDADGVVPVEMGRELAGVAPGITRYIEIPNLDHMSILEEAESYFYSTTESR